MKLKYTHIFSLMIAMAIILIFSIGILRPKPLSSLIQKEKFWADKVHSKKQYDVIIAGDSRIYRGVDPKSVSIQLGGLEVINFGFSSGGHNKVIFKEISNRLNMKAEKRIIILGLTPYSLTPKAQENKHFNQENDRDEKEVFNRRFINPIFAFFDPIKPTDLIYKQDTIPGYHESFKNNGWVASYKIPADSNSALVSYKKNFQHNEVQTDILKELTNQIRQWVSSGIFVFALRMPTTHAMEILENELSGFNENKVRKSVEDAGGQWIYFNDKYGYESYDGSHLTQNAAIRFSIDLGNNINKKLRAH